MLDAIGTIIIAGAMAVIVTAVLTTMPLRLLPRLAVAWLAGAWVGLAAAVAETGALAQPLAILVLFATPLVTAGLVMLAAPTVRHAVGAMPLEVLQGVHILRVVGVVFLFLAFAGRLSGPFPYFAALGDMLTGALAIRLVWSAANERPVPDRWIFAWNSLGTLDLVLAVTLALVSGRGSPLQLIHTEPGAAAMQSLPWALVPTVLVPFFLITHGIIFGRLRRRRARAIAGRPGAGGRVMYSH